MTRTKAELLSNLDPHNPASIQALIDFHRETFGGWKMEGPDGAKPEGDQGQSGDQAKPEGGKPEDKGKPDDKPLGPNGEKALQEERDARKALEREFGQFKANLASVLGGNGQGAKPSTDDVLAGIQQQMAAMQHENLVLTVANSNQITDDGDLGLLRDFKGDEDGLRKLADRLKPSGVAGAQSQKPRTPAPDHSQGKGSSGSGVRPSSVAQVMADRRAAREAKSK